ncbi:MAG: hypothetical protein ACRDND_35230, partial [Streptosporangiaceae bacterium]
MSTHIYDPGASGFCGVCGEQATYCTGALPQAAAMVAEPAFPAGPDDPAPGEPWSELGYARRLIAVYGDRLRYLPAWRRWLAWDGQRWAADDTGQAQRWMKAISRRMTTAALALT